MDIDQMVPFFKKEVKPCMSQPFLSKFNFNRERNEEK